MILSIKKLMAIVALAGSFLALSNSAEAFCLQSGNVQYIYTDGSTYTIYLAPNNTATPSFYYTYNTTNSKFVDVLASSMASDRQVYIYGNAASCPTVGIYRNGGSISNITAIRN